MCVWVRARKKLGSVVVFLAFRLHGKHRLTYLFRAKFCAFGRQGFWMAWENCQSAHCSRRTRSLLVCHVFALVVFCRSPLRCQTIKLFLPVPFTKLSHSFFRRTKHEKSHSHSHTYITLFSLIWKWFKRNTADDAVPNSYVHGKVNWSCLLRVKMMWQPNEK